MERGDVFKCSDCGSLLESLTGCECGPTACDKGLERLEAHTQDEGKEKHVPVIEKTDAGIIVRVGSVAHPMEEGHWIQWIEVTAGDSVYRRYLSPGDAPEAEFPVTEYDVVREHCSVHGMWRAQP